jgi:hypothetical protein
MLGKKPQILFKLLLNTVVPWLVQQQAPNKYIFG